MNKEVNGVKVLFGNLVWDEVVKVYRQNEEIKASNKKEKNEGNSAVEESLKARI